MADSSLPLPAPRLGRRHALGLLAAALVAARLPAAQAAPAVSQRRKIASGLYEIVFSRADGLVYVAAAGDRGQNNAAILGLDPRSLETRATIPLEDPGFGLAVNNRTGRLYTTHTRTGSISVIDIASRRLLANVRQGEGAHLRQALVDEAGNRVFVSVFGARDKPSAIWVIDGAGNRITDVITEGLEGGIIGLAHDPAGDRLFCTALQSNEVVEVSLARKAAVRRFLAGGEGPINLAFDAGRQRLLVANQKSGTLAVLGTDGTLVKSLPTGQGALGVALNAARGLAYVANRGAGTVSIVDAEKLEVLAELKTGTHPNTVAVDPASGLAWVSNKARSAGRGQPPVDDPDGDTVSLIAL